MLDYRGSTVEDLQLSPALVLSSATSVGTAVQMAFERDFTILPISHPDTRQLIGWINATSLSDSLKKGAVDPDAAIGSLELSSRGVSGGEGGLKKFNRAKGYTVITPDTALEELESFFAAGQASGVGFALVTDQSRKFVLGVVTPEDLDKFVTRRNLK